MSRKAGFLEQTYVMKSLVSRLLFRKSGFSRKSGSRKSGFDNNVCKELTESLKWNDKETKKGTSFTPQKMTDKEEHIPQIPSRNEEKNAIP